MEDRNSEKAREVIKRHEMLAGDRVNWESHWQEIAERVLPRMSREFQSLGVRTPGEKRTELMFDSTAALGLERFSSVLDSMITPQGSKWHRLRASVPALNKSPRVLRYFDEVTDILFRYRYAPRANFVSQNLENWLSLGAFGTGGVFVDRLAGGGLRYKAINLAEWFFLENHQGQIDTAHRKFRMTARQVMQKFTKDSDNIPERVARLASDRPEDEVEFIHCVKPRSDLDPTRMDYRGMAYTSYYVCLEGPTMVREEGYSTFPVPVSRYVTAPGEVYGRSPAMMVLPNIKVLNEQKKTALKVGHRLADPIILAHDDGVLDMFSLTPGTQVPGGIDAQGRKLVASLDMPNGQLPALDKMMEQERMVINDAFLVSLFQILVQTPSMTATEVLERTREKGMLLAPTMGRQQSEYLGPLIERELDVLARDGLLPQMPQELVEAAGDYTVQYDSPLSRTMRSEEASGFMRWLETSLNVAAQTQDPSALDWVDFDTAQPELADILAVPNRWVATSEQVAEKRQGRQQAGQTQQLIQSLPGIAAMAKAGVGGAPA
jgi:hypothetical protein